MLGGQRLVIDLDKIHLVECLGQWHRLCSLLCIQFWYNSSFLLIYHYFIPLKFVIKRFKLNCYDWVEGRFWCGWILLFQPLLLQLFLCSLLSWFQPLKTIQHYCSLFSTKLVIWEWDQNVNKNLCIGILISDLSSDA